MGLSVDLVDLCKDMKTGNVHFVGWSWALRCNDMNLRFHLRICSFAIVHVLSSQVAVTLE